MKTTSEGVEVRLAGRVVVVSGAARGIGAACARRAASEGARVVLCDIAPSGEEIASAIRKTGGQAVFHPADTASAADIAAVLKAAESAFGVVDGCIAAAGVAPMTPFLEVEEGAFMRVLEINLKGPLLLGQAVARQLVAAGRGGAIVNVTSTSARLAGATQAAYCASKAGLDGLTRVMAVALAPHGIRVNALAPGPTRTELTSQVPAQAIAMVLSRTPLGRMCGPEEQASVAAFLLSDEASFITGETIYADGGRCALNFTVEPRGN